MLRLLPQFLAPLLGFSAPSGTPRELVSDSVSIAWAEVA